VFIQSFSITLHLRLHPVNDILLYIIVRKNIKEIDLKINRTF